MTVKLTDNTARGSDMAAALKNWTMVGLTLIFALLYGGALLGWIKPLTDERAVGRIEPIIFVIIGYYFGRLPSQQNESTLKEEITRQAQKADAAQHAKEQAQQARESLEEKVKNVRSTLTLGAQPRGQGERLSGASESPRDDSLRASLAAALRILNS
ncbi:MAG TPA: hypothetical protein VE262_18330 [Blastocatellia bacterium]|nr:hypothetical protein [Blastocatellia bacterium]